MTPALDDGPASTSDGAKTCLLIIDMINQFDFPDAGKLFPAILASAERIACLKRRAASAGIPVIDLNDNFGKWRHDVAALVAQCLDGPCNGQPIAALLRPNESDYFVLKPNTPASMRLRWSCCWGSWACAAFSWRGR